MTHYIITRFNLGVYDRPDAEEWMRNRVKLFERFTLPSIEAQVCINFEWIVFFDPLTPNQVVSKYNTFDFYRGVRGDDILKYLGKIYSDGTFITSRLDSDDYIEPCYVKRVQDTAERITGDTIIDFRGRVLDATTGKFYNPMRPSPTSMFLSLVEFGSQRSVYVDQHNMMHGRYPSVMLDDYGWVMVCHRNNLVNAVTPDMTDDVPQTYYVR